ncbi:MAG: hypothetical protein ACE5NA_09005 [Nitrospiraceae bacterium]
MHQTMLDGNVEYIPKVFLHGLIENFSHLVIVLLDLGYGGPVLGLVIRQLPSRRVDAEREQLVQFSLKRGDPQRVTAYEIPIERLHVPQVKNDPVAFRDGTFVERVRS